MNNNALILSIESSCDDSSIAITRIDDYALLYHKKISQELEHTQHGGVVPELASRLHAVALPQILQECQAYFEDIKAIAVTNAPGLAVTLMEGVIMAKALAISLDVPLIGVHHLKGHIYSQFIGKEAVMPQTILLISGGHTQILHAHSFERIDIVATSSDDSFGESFDKVAKMMGLGYPGGPIVEKLAQNGDDKRFDFPVPLSKSPRMEFSYSGLKNAVRLAIEANTPLDEVTRCDIAAGFQKAATQHLLQKMKKYLKTAPKMPLAIVGGASANKYVRLQFETLCESCGISLHTAPLEFCSDNAAMIGRVGVQMYHRGEFSSINDLEINPRTQEIT